MAEYHYKYTPSGGSGNSTGAPGNENRNNGGDDWGSWIVPVIFLATPLWPLGLFLLIRKLLTGTSSRRSNVDRSAAARTNYTYNYTYDYSKAKSAQAQAQAAAQSQAQAQAQAAQRQAQARINAQARKKAGKPDPLAGTQAQKPVNPKAGRGFIISGGIVSGIFLFCLLIMGLVAITESAVWEFLPALTTLACFSGIGLMFLRMGLTHRKKVKMFRKYLGLIGMRKSVSISTLSKATRRSYNKVCDDLQDMLDQGIFPIGYLDLANDKLVLTTDGIEDEEDEEPEEEKVEAKPDDSILAEIRAVNDSIPDPVMTAKIARIEEITGKILDYQRRYPAKAGQLRNFLNYYLPTTLKILRAYAQLDEQGIEGENISAAKARIEGMMDKVVEGFEKQLDKLFQNDVLDISSDVAVLEKMLDNDGLGSSGMTMGGV